MGYDKKIISDLLRELEAKRDARERMLSERRQQVYARIPRVRQIDEILRGTAASVLRAALESGDDPAKAIEQLRGQNLALQHERVRLLMDHGLPADFLDDKPGCPLCGDLGYVGSEPCQMPETHVCKAIDRSALDHPAHRRPEFRYVSFGVLFGCARRAHGHFRAGEHGIQSGSLCGVCPSFWPPVAQPAAFRFDRAGQNLPIHLHRQNSGRVRVFGCLRHSHPRARLLRVRQI